MNFGVVNLEPIFTRVLKKILKREHVPARGLLCSHSCLCLLFLSARKADQWVMGGGGSRKRAWVGAWPRLDLLPLLFWVY